MRMIVSLAAGEWLPRLTAAQNATGAPPTGKLVDPTGKEIWTGSYSGEGKNYGSSKSAENYNETLSDAIKNAKSGKLKGGANTIYGASVNGVGYGKWSPKVPAKIKSAIAAQYVLLKAGKIKGIPTTVK